MNKNNLAMMYDTTLDKLYDEAVDQLEQQAKMRKFKNYVLEDCDGNVLVTGRYNDVMRVLYPRYVYSHHFDDVMYWDGTYIDKNGCKF